MSEPDYIAQAKRPETREEERKWIKERRDEMTMQGCMAGRVSICPPGTWPHLDLILVEGWEDPQADQGEPHWQLTSNPGIKEGGTNG